MTTKPARFTDEEWANIRALQIELEKPENQREYCGIDGPYDADACRVCLGRYTEGRGPGCVCGGTGLHLTALRLDRGTA